MVRRILVTGAGGGGGENLINSLKKGKINLFIYGSNMDEMLLAKSTADKTVWLPSARNDEYLDYLVNLIEKEKIELVIPNNDTEVGRISKDQENIPCKVFLPPNETVEICQDKLRMYKILSDADVPVAKTIGLTNYQEIDVFVEECASDRYWIRPRRGSGSMGATWVKNSEQARSWINLWIELRDFKLNDFVICEFLPGRDFAFQSVWKDGELVVAKMVERLSYIMARNRLSNMSSSPSVAKTVRDEKTLEMIFRAIKTVSTKPHGNYNLDLKGDVTGQMCVTEFNIGRFCMITPVFDLTGKYNTAEMHVRSALNLPIEIDDPIDIEEDVYLIRELDTVPTVIRNKDLKKIINSAKKTSHIE